MKNATFTFSLNSHSLLSDVQKAFHKTFPHLRLTFFTPPRLICQVKASNQEIPAHTQIKDISTFKSPGSIEFAPGKLVAEFEQYLWTQFGLFARVMRDAGSHCIQTTASGRRSTESQEEGSHAMHAQSDKLKRL